jgi:hypothetical protein
MLEIQTSLFSAEVRLLNVKKKEKKKVGFMVFHATFNNISVLSWPSVLLVEETGGPGENH